MSQNSTDSSIHASEAFPGSRKIYIKGKIHDIRVPMREIELDDEATPQLTLYDSSGSFTDPEFKIDLKKGLPRIREQWIEDRNDVEELENLTSSFC